MIKYLQIFLIVILSVLTLYLGIELYKCKHAPIPYASTSFSLDSGLTITPTTVYRDTQNNHHVVIDAKINSLIDKQATETATQLAPVIQKVADDLNIKSAQVESGLTISSQVSRDSVAFLKRQLDNARNLTFYYKDKYLTLDVNTNLKDTADLGSFTYKYNADLNIYQYYKKSWSFGAKKSYIDISSNDSNSTVMGVKKFTVVQPYPEFGVRLQATIGRNFMSKTTSVGPSIRIDLGNKLKASV